MDNASQTTGPVTSASDSMVVPGSAALPDSAPILSTMETMGAEMSDGLMDGYVHMADRASLSVESENEGKIPTSGASEGAGNPEPDVCIIQKDEGHEGMAAVARESSNGSSNVVSGISSEERVDVDVLSAPEQGGPSRDQSGHQISSPEKSNRDKEAGLAELDEHEEARMSKPGTMIESEDVELPALRIDQTSSNTYKRTIIPDSEDVEDEDEQLSIRHCKIVVLPGTEELVQGDSLPDLDENQNSMWQQDVEDGEATKILEMVPEADEEPKRDEGGTKLGLAAPAIDADPPVPPINEEATSPVLYEETLDEDEVSEEGKDETASPTAKYETRIETINNPAGPLDVSVQENNEATSTIQTSENMNLDLMTQTLPGDSSTLNNNTHVQTTLNPQAENPVSKAEPLGSANSVTSPANANSGDQLQDLELPSSSSSSFQQPSTVVDIPPIEPLPPINEEVTPCTDEKIPSMQEEQLVFSVQEPPSSFHTASSAPEIPRKRAYPHHIEPISSPLKAMLPSSPPAKKQKNEDPETMSDPVEGKEASKTKDELLVDELRAMKIASIQARNSSLEAEIARVKARLEAVTDELEHPAAETVKSHIHLLHQYNDMRDVGQGLLGMIAENRGGMRVGDLYEEFGVGLQD